MLLTSSVKSRSLALANDNKKNSDTFDRKSVVLLADFVSSSLIYPDSLINPFVVRQHILLGSSLSIHWSGLLRYLVSENRLSQSDEAVVFPFQEHT